MKSALALIVLASLFLSSVVSAFPIIINHDPTLVSRADIQHVPFYSKSKEVEEVDTATFNDLADASGKQSRADIQHVPFDWKSKEDEADTVKINDLADEGRDVSSKQSPADISHVPFYWKSKEVEDTVATNGLADEGLDTSGKRHIPFSWLHNSEEKDKVEPIN
ncbi:hypothetical protein B0H11DRAFT_2274993 [Mycena galericulata]|nr:hypothetical protein B0H11DRAFT_2274993 [Mycena galericulata]